MTMSPYYNNVPKTPKRYFNLGVFSCSLGGVVFSIGIVLVVLGSSPQEADAVWIAGIVLLLLGGLLFFIGISSVGIYLQKEDRRRKEEQREAARLYAASLRGSSEIILAE